MKHSLPVLLASKNEDFRQLLREMLGKQGYFHVLEAQDEEEAFAFFREHREKSLALVHGPLMSAGMVSQLRSRSEFLVIAQSEDDQTVSWAAQLGVKHILSFPFSARVLLEKIETIL